MKNRENIDNFVTYILLAIIFIFGAIIIFNVIYTIIYALLFGYIFYPIHKKLSHKIKNNTLSVIIICFVLLISLVAIILISIGPLLKELINLLLFLEKTNLNEVIINSLPSPFASYEIVQKTIETITNSLSRLIEYLINNLDEYIIQIPKIILDFIIFGFIFFFSLRNGKDIIEYIKSFLTLKKETEARVFKNLKNITDSILLGQILVAVIQGLLAGLIFFVLGIPNALLLTFVTIFLSMIPMIGAIFVWAPVDIYLFATGRPFEGIILLIYGALIISSIDNVLRLIILSKKTKLNNAIILIGMIGGLLTFGFLGLLLGPLILAYVLLVLDTLKNPTNL